MTRLILTTDDSAAGALRASGIADLVLPILRRFGELLAPRDPFYSAASA
jgi:hypothetical protein